MDSKEVCKVLEMSNMGSKYAKAIVNSIVKRNELEREYIQSLVNEIDKRLYSLENLIDKKYVVSDDFLNFTIKTLRQASNDIRKEKIKMFANVIVNSALIDKANTEDRRKYLYVEVIDKIDEELFAFLLKLKSRSITKGHELDLGWTGKEPELKEMGIDLTTFRTNGDYLMSTGLMTRIHQIRYKMGGESIKVQDEYYVTEFGVGFIEYVRVYDASEDAEVELL